MSKFCAFPGCDNPPSPKAAKGLCNSHYWQLHKGRELTPLSYRRNVLHPWMEEHVNYQGDECLMWPFAVEAKTGRPQIKVNGKTRMAARVMCEMAHGKPPTPLHEAAHSCGKAHEGCINPNHLSWKTHTENMADQLVHGTRARGERQGSAKLTTPEVLAIRDMRGIVSQSTLAKQFGVRQSHIGRIQRHERWGHV